MEKASVNITLRKDGRYMGKFCIGYDDNGKAQYQYVYGRTYNEAESKVVIGQQISRNSAIVIIKGYCAESALCAR